MLAPLQQLAVCAGQVSRRLRILWPAIGCVIRPFCEAEGHAQDTAPFHRKEILGDPSPMGYSWRIRPGLDRVILIKRRCAR